MRDVEWYDPAHDCRDYGGKNNTPNGCRMCEAMERRLARPSSHGQLQLIKRAVKDKP